MNISALLDGFASIAVPSALLALFVGVLVGSIVGVLPGIGPIGAMAILMPFSFTLEPTVGILMLSGIYFGAMYGGSTTSILMRVPGEASSVVTSIDGYEMTKRGRAGAALAVAAMGSFVAGTLAVLALMLVAPSLSEFAIGFAAPEYLALAIFALFVLSRLSGGSLWPAMAAAGLGLILATIGLDPGSGNTRFTFDVLQLSQGVDITALAVGLYGLAEIFLMVERKGTIPPLARVRMRELYPTRAELRRAVPAMFRGGLIGFLLGLTPGPSGVLSTYASYWVERRVSKHKDEFGKGAIEGVAGPEAANNGASGGAMVPLLVLGIPFAAPTALLLGGFTVHNIIPGPLLIQQQPTLFWGLIAGMYVANVLLLVLNLPLVGMFVQLLRVPRDILVGFIVLIAVLGTFATRNSMFDVVVLIVMGILGYLMVKANLPRATLILAFIIGPLLESSLVQTLNLAQGDAGYLFTRPIAATLVGLTILALVAPPIVNAVRRSRPVAPALVGEPSVAGSDAVDVRAAQTDQVETTSAAEQHSDAPPPSMPRV